jgi:pimeloyl-ACP methyl ester carboxylesterase
MKYIESSQINAWSILKCTKPMVKLISNSCILLHGAWHSGWAWTPIINSIKKAGYYKNVIAPDLPGHHNNKSDFKNITLETYTNYVLNLMKSLPGPVTLIGHSMSGIVISSIAEQAPSKVANLIYVSGFIPDNGGSLTDEEQKAKNPSVALAVTVDKNNYTIKIDREKAKGLFYNCSDVKYIDEALIKLQEQPLLPFLSPVTLSEKNFGSVKKFYISCLKDQAIHPTDQKRMGLLKKLYFNHQEYS